MKKFIAIAVCLASFSAFAATVKVTSFNFVRTAQNFSGPLAELCGKVEGAVTAPTFLKVSVDPNTNNPGSYNTLAGDDGKFCLAVITFRGRAEVSIIGENSSTEALIK